MVACCTTIDTAEIARSTARGMSRAGYEARAGVQVAADGSSHCRLSVPAIHCGVCIPTIERGLAGCEGVAAVRVNLTLRRVDLTLSEADADPLPAMQRLAALGYPASPLDPAGLEDQGDAAEAARLLRALAVAGFGAANIMLMSVAVWSGADAGLRGVFHIVSGAIAVPVVLYAVQPFWISSWRALRAGHTNMDVPITLAVLLAVGSSIYETVQGGHQVFFDAAVTLLFFLLIGRYLDRLMRAKARSAVTGLARLSARGAMRLRPDGGLDYLALDEIAPGMILRIAAGERLPVDICVERGRSDLDRSLVTGESVPMAAGPGDVLEAGTLNLTGGLDVRVLRPASGSYLAEMMAMLEAAERGRGRYVRIADRASRLYAPVVHLMALLTFAGWMIATGDGHRAVFVAISVLIITCPCALGLAVPVAHVVGAGRLFRDGILMKDGSALERLAEIDGAVFDKTGTLTTDLPLVTGCAVAEADRAAALGLALHSTHPVSKALARYLGGVPAGLSDVVEVPGRGIEARVAGRLVRLGQGAWVGEIAGGAVAGHAFAVEGGQVAGFSLSETLRPGAGAAVRTLQEAGLSVAILSGDAPEPVGRIAAELGVAQACVAQAWAGQSPADKIARLEALRADGHRVLMVGDGLNDTAALAAAHVSMAPASASDAGRMAADFVFTRDGLEAVSNTWRVAKHTAQIVHQNFVLAIGYNAIAIPLAVAGHVTPLVAALAMSGSSIIVVGNSLRLNRAARQPRQTQMRKVIA